MPQGNFTPRSFGARLRSPREPGTIAPTGPFDPGVLKLTTSTGADLGLARIEAVSDGQIERWMLFANPMDDFQIHSAGQRDAWDTATWNAHVKAQWDQGKVAYYVRARSRMYTYEDWRRGIPFPLPDAPNPLDARGKGISLSAPTRQIDDGAQITQLRKLCGYVASVKLDGTTPSASLEEPISVELWMTSPDFVAAGEAQGPVTLLEPHPVFEQGQITPKAFVELAQGHWAPGATFTITGCANFTPKGPMPEL